MKQLITKLPHKYRMTIHNVVGHPLMEILHLVGLETIANIVHDSTLPLDSEE